MAEISGFFNSMVDDDGNYDREYLAENFAAYFASFIGNGVFPNPSSGLQVIANSGMNVILQIGQAWINGYWYSNTANRMFTLSPASGTTERVDAIVIRWSASGRLISAAVKEGAPSLSPQRPLPQRDADAYELIVAYVHVSRNIINITQTNIEDTRLNPELCGIVHGVVDQIDTTTLGIQLQTFIDEYMERFNSDYSDFTEFVDGLKDSCNEQYNNFLNELANLLGAAMSNYNAYVGNLGALLTQFQQNVTAEFGSFLNFLQGYRDDSAAAYSELLLWFNGFKVDSETEFQDWFDTIKGILGEDEAGALLLLIQELQASVPSISIGVVEHGLNRYPDGTLYQTTDAYGINSYGMGSYGGGPLQTTPAEYSLSGTKTIEIIVKPEFAGLTNTAQINGRMHSFYSSSPTENRSLVLMLR